MVDGRWSMVESRPTNNIPIDDREVLVTSRTFPDLYGMVWYIAVAVAEERKKCRCEKNEMRTRGGNMDPILFYSILFHSTRRRVPE